MYYYYKYEELLVLLYFTLCVYLFILSSTLQIYFIIIILRINNNIIFYSDIYLFILFSFPFPQSKFLYGFCWAWVSSTVHICENVSPEISIRIMLIISLHGYYTHSLLSDNYPHVSGSGSPLWGDREAVRRFESIYRAGRVHWQLLNSRAASHNHAHTFEQFALFSWVI